MGFEKQFASTKNHIEKIPDQNIDILNKQLEEAIKEDDFEQAVVLRDFIKFRQDNSICSEIEMSDLVDFRGEGNGCISEDDPEHRVWEGIESKRDKIRFEGKEEIDNSILSGFLTGEEKNIVKLEHNLDRRLEKLSDKKDVRRIDLLLNLRDKCEEAKKMRDLAQEKLDQVWRPYRKQMGLSDCEYEEYDSAYNKVDLTAAQKSKLDYIPSSIHQPAAYWQHVYDNSRLLLEVLNEAIEELEQ
ncbi:MAG: hypothetical protein WCT50_00555 [Patescibacteria group bacterium]